MCTITAVVPFRVLVGSPASFVVPSAGKNTINLLLPYNVIYVKSYLLSNTPSSLTELRGETNIFFVTNLAKALFGVEITNLRLTKIMRDYQLLNNSSEMIFAFRSKKASIIARVGNKSAKRVELLAMLTFAFKL